MATIKVLLKPSVTRGDVEYMTMDYEWQVYRRQDQTESRGAYTVWTIGEGGEQSVIIYTEDGFAELRYITVEGINAEEIVDQIHCSIDLYTRDELLQAVTDARNSSEKIAALRRLGVSLSKDFDEAAFTTLSKALKDHDPLVRLGAIAAIGFPAWPQFVEPLTRVQETDDDVRVLRRSARLMGLLQRANASGGDCKFGTRIE